MFCKYLFLGLILSGSISAAQAQSQTGGPVPSDSATSTAVATTAAPAPSPADIETQVREQTRSGQLDFTKMLASKKQTMFLYDGNMYNKREYALALWGARAKAMGVASVERAYAVYEAATSRALSPADKHALANGFASATRE